MKTPRRWRLIVALQLGAVALGTALAIGTSHAPAATFAYAANHCTRFAPIISQDYQCGVNGTMYTTGTYSTPSVALRDSNDIYLASSRPWSLDYFGSGIYSSGTGTHGHLGSSNGYRRADCNLGGSSVSGHCVTNWHD